MKVKKRYKHESDRWIVIQDGGLCYVTDYEHAVGRVRGGGSGGDTRNPRHGVPCRITCPPTVWRQQCMEYARSSNDFMNTGYRGYDTDKTIASASVY